MVKISPCFQLHLISPSPQLPPHCVGLLLGPGALHQHHPFFFFFLKKETDPEGICFMDKQPELIWWPRQEELKEQSFDPSANHCSIWPGAMEIHTSSGSQEDPETVKMSHESTELKPKDSQQLGLSPWILSTVLHTHFQPGESKLGSVQIVLTKYWVSNLINNGKAPYKVHHRTWSTSKYSILYLRKWSLK